MVESIFDDIEMKPTLRPESAVNWNVVKLVMEGFTERYPDDMVGCMEYVKQLKETKENEFASSGDSGHRHLYEIPARLHKALSAKYPTLFEGDNLKQFLELYPALRVADKM